MWTLSRVYALFRVFRLVALPTNLTSDVGFNGHIHCLYPLLVQVRLHILVETPRAKSLFHVGKSGNNSRGLPERARITQRPRAKERIPLFVEHTEALQ